MNHRARTVASIACLAVALTAACGGGLAVVGGDAAQAVSLRDGGALDGASATDLGEDLPSASDAQTDDGAPRDRVEPPRDLPTADVDDAGAAQDVADVAGEDRPPAVEDLPPPSDTGVADADPGPADAMTLDTGSGSACVGRCMPGETCCAGRCVDLAMDPLHCGLCDARCTGGTQCVSGSCRPPCPPGQNRCGLACVDLLSARDHCGACDTACPGGQDCVDGRCTTVCPMGQVNCNGSCVDPRTDEGNCGACNMRCAPRVTCFQGSCYTQCGSTSPTFCPGPNYCADTLTDRTNCGACLNQCPAGQVCIAGTCACPPGQISCGGGCISATCTAGVGNCANAGPQRCVNGAAVCDAVPGAPGVEVCNNRDDDCNGVVDEGLMRPCYMGPGTPGVGVCRNGAQVCAAGVWGTCNSAVGPTSETCNGMDDDCNGLADDLSATACFTVSLTQRNVGLCRDGVLRCAGAGATTCANERTPLPEICNGMDDDCNGTADDAVDVTRCPGRLNASPIACAGGACQYACANNFGSCDGDPTNGCEADLRSSNAHCGGCNRPCGTGQFCDNGSCRTNCSGALCGGVCVDTAVSTQHCGACGRVCTPPAGGSSLCMAGTCVNFCGAGSTLCNGACVNLTADANHCGACGAACRTGQACVTRLGVPRCECTNGQIECGGQCVPPLTDAFNCGGCGIRCGGGASCVGGICQCTGTSQALCGGNCVTVGQPCSAGVGGCRRSGVTACLLGFVQCNAVPGTPLTEVCNNVDDDCDGVVDNSNAEDSCQPVPFKTATCVSGACAYQCFAGRGDCDGMLANGCETSLLDDPRNCNRCGVSCGNGVCLAGGCVPCATGQTMCNNACTNLRDDPSNCGACGARCGLGEFCDGGACRPTGPDGGVIDGGSSTRDGGDTLG